jgi:dihydrolipoamide dehydrogenase
MASNEPYDVVVLGAGPGGYVAAIRAAQLGLRTAIIEKEFLGGVCLNIGCIPSKALLRNAEIARLLGRGKDFGFSFENLHLDFSVAVKRSREVSDRLVKGVGFLMRKNKIDVVMGTGTLQAADRIQVVDGEGKEQTVQAKNIIIATGARVRELPNIAMDGERIISYREAILQEKLPKSVVVIGAGAIGCEFTTTWRSYGSEVYLVELLEHILPLEDDQVAEELTKSFGKFGVKVFAGSKVTAAEVAKDKVRVKIEGPKGEQTVEVEQVLVATGVRPNSENIGLEALGVQTERGFIVVDDGLRTNVPGVYAIGDVTGKLLLAHVGSAQGIVAAETIAGHETIKLDYMMMPRPTYSHPQVASFGLTEKQAREQGHEIKIGQFPFRPNGRALSLGEPEGFVKIIADAKYGEILGAHLIGPEVTELLPELTLARMWELTPAEIARNVHSHPTLSEVLMEAAHGVEGQAIHI